MTKTPSFPVKLLLILHIEKARLIRYYGRIKTKVFTKETVVIKVKT